MWPRTVRAEAGALGLFCNRFGVEVESFTRDQPDRGFGKVPFGGKDFRGRVAGVAEPVSADLDDGRLFDELVNLSTDPRRGETGADQRGRYRRDQVFPLENRTLCGKMSGQFSKTFCQQLFGLFGIVNGLLPQRAFCNGGQINAHPRGGLSPDGFPVLEGAFVLCLPGRSGNGGGKRDSFGAGDAVLDEFSFDLLATGRKMVDQDIFDAGNLENPVPTDPVDV